MDAPEVPEGWKIWKVPAGGWELTAPDGKTYRSKTAMGVAEIIRNHGTRDARMYPSYTNEELEKWLAERDLDSETRKKVEMELANRKSGASAHRVTPQASWGSGPAMRPINKLGRQ
jgi:hypothetical protein